MRPFDAPADPYAELRDDEPIDPHIDRRDWRGEVPAHVVAPAAEALPEVGSKFWVSKSGIMLMLASSSGRLEGIVSRRGDCFTVDARTLELSFDRLGRSWLALILDEERQVRRWGARVLWPGEPPADLDPIDRTSPAEVAAERARRLEAAALISDPVERLQAGRAIAADLGHAGASVTLRGGR